MQPSSIENTGNAQPYGASSNPSLMTKKETEDRIRSLDAENIEELAKGLVLEIMIRLDIDVFHFKVLTHKGPYQKDELSEPVVGFNGESKLRIYLLNQVKNLLTETFSTPAQFVEKGSLEISLFNLDKTGILDLVDYSLKNQLNESKTKHNINTLKATYSIESGINTEIGKAEIQLGRVISST